MPRISLGPLERALVVEEPHDTLDDLLVGLGMTVHRKRGDAPEEAELIELLQQTRAQVLFKRSRVPVTRAVVEACPDLLVVQLCCIGDDSVDKQACADHGVTVFNDPVSNGRSVVELVVANLIGLSRRLFETDAGCRTGQWDKSNKARYEVRGKILGVVGLGNIGRASARICEQLGMEIRFHDSREVAREVGREFGWTACETIEELLETSDCVTVHVSARDVNGQSNEGILSGGILHRLGKQRPEGSPRIFLNLSRGFLHTAEDLRSAIEAGAIRRAAVDVYPSEPRGKGVPWTNPYGDLRRVAVTPHLGASTQEAQPRIAERVTRTLSAFSTRGTVRDCVFAPRANLGLGEEARSAGGAVLFVVHSTARGTKRSIDDAIFAAGASNLSSVHRDFGAYGVAFDVASIDAPLSEEQLEELCDAAARLTGREDAIRSIRQITV
jgi:D-3-phosphoglycerate dehydrogenase